MKFLESSKSSLIYNLRLTDGKNTIYKIMMTWKCLFTVVLVSPPTNLITFGIANDWMVWEIRRAIFSALRVLIVVIFVPNGRVKKWKFPLGGGGEVARLYFLLQMA